MTYKKRNRNMNATYAFEPATVLVREKVDVNAADIKTAEYLGRGFWFLPIESMH